MKKLIVLLLVFTALPQLAQNNKGRISLTFNDEKFDLPVRMIMFNKDNDIRISARGETNDSLNAKWVSLELGFDVLSNQKPKHGLKDFGMHIQSRNTKNSDQKRFVFNYGTKEAHIEFYKNYERVSLQTPFLHFVIKIINVEYTGNELKISGTFEGELKSDNDGKNSVTVEIKDGKFEILL